ncbi:cytochrome c oxidase assembly protein [Streptomyces sp. H27-C3]|uniref:cytochrome c oxidase assembly protein n=1 Tax=Streptomyces sp. H27-C3 TaxID=3046305 RepID=UPI0024B8D0FE|nr:cytochrome c oxidase assembly protein [Streptomyces sp. H27-C3]MDJ0462707.1 cytochrome c oxidase assembly protein [Streptomyces sp. H27-C3]
MTTPLIAAVLAGCLGYLAGSARLRGRGDSWPRSRDLAFCAGGLVMIAALGVPRTTHWPPFTGHMAGHLGSGMAAPLLVALGRPVTLALRALPTAPRRRLLAVTRSRPVETLAWPPVAALVNVGVLWLLYRAPVPSYIHHSPLLHAHLFASGVLFTFAVLAVDPVRHRAGFPLRAVTLVAASAAHAVLAKSLYAAGPPGMPYGPADLHFASQVMYYGGDVVEVALALALVREWYRAEGRALDRARAPRPPRLPGDQRGFRAP